MERDEIGTEFENGTGTVNGTGTEWSGNKKLQYKNLSTILIKI